MQRELAQEITQVYGGEYESYKYANTKSIYTIALSFITTRHGSQTNKHFVIGTLGKGEHLLHKMARNSLFQSRLNVQCYIVNKRNLNI